MKLSICIPTYNRLEFLKVLLDSIVQSISVNNFESIVEICISDNCSTDGTDEYIHKFCKINESVKITYKRNDRNLGPDLNYVSSVSLAIGEYCWIVGSDDSLELDSIKYIIDYINNNLNLGIFLFNRRECDINMRFVRNRFWLPEEINNYTFQFSNHHQLNIYFNLCQSLGGVFSYLSSIVFKRDLWNSIPINNDYIGTAYIHAYILFKIMGTTDFATYEMHYISEQFVNSRGGNDSFFVNQHQRFMLDLVGYNKLSDVFDNFELKKSLIRILGKEHPAIYLDHSRILYNLTQDDFDFIFKSRIYSDLELNILSEMLMYKKLYFISRILVRVINKAFNRK